MQQDARRTGDDERPGALQRDAAARGAELGGAAGAAVGAALEGAGQLSRSSAAAAARGVEAAREGGARVAAGGLSGALQDVRTAVASASDVLDGVVERGPAAVAVLSGRRAPRRWPWAVGAAVVGAATGAGVALLVQRLLGQDAPGAQEPDQLVAVVDAEALTSPLRTPGGLSQL